MALNDKYQTESPRPSTPGVGSRDEGSTGFNEDSGTVEESFTPERSCVKGGKTRKTLESSDGGPSGQP